MINDIKQAIQNQLNQAQVFVADPMNDGQHFQAIVVSPDFSNISLVKQHQMVMNALKSEFDTNTVHALSLKTFTPEKWEEEKQHYPGAK